MTRKALTLVLVLIGVGGSLWLAGTLAADKKAARDRERREMVRRREAFAESGLIDYKQALDREVPDFSFDASVGSKVSLADLKGSLWVAAFMFTRCPDNKCPDMSRMIAKLQGNLSDLPDVKFVTFSVDPERDTIAALKEYAVHYGADPERWYFLRGPLEETHELAWSGFLLGSKQTPQNHSQKLTLVDREGRIRGYYDGSGPDRVADCDELEQDIRKLHAGNDLGAKSEPGGR